MFKKSPNHSQLDAFTSPETLFSGNTLKMYEDDKAWHNQFRKEVSMRIDEGVFSPLYSERNGSPNASIRVMVTMMVLKEAEGISDQKLFESCRFNMLTRSALGLFNACDLIPTESTYYLFRKRILEYSQETQENLLETVFTQITKGQCTEFEVSGKRIRMDSKLLGSNIAWLSRYELIHETLRLFYKEIKKSVKKDKEIWDRLDELMQMEGKKVVYTSSNIEIKSRIEELGILINTLLPLFKPTKPPHYETLQRVFDEQYSVDQDKVVLPRNKKEVSAKSVQSPHDTDCHYRNKGDQNVKGYSFNLTESCDDDNSLNLISQVTVKKASTSDVDFLQTSISKAQDVFKNKPQYAHADGAYHSPDNQKFCEKEKIELYLHAIQGARSRYEFHYCKKGELSIFDAKNNMNIEWAKLIGKNEIEKWRIKTENGYRYFTQKDIETSLLRRKIAETPIETLQKRNNVEATVFQLGFRCSNAKTRYRGEIKQQMWANMRCLWVNFVRIMKRVGRIVGKSFFCYIFVNKLQHIDGYLLKTKFILVIKTVNRYVNKNIQLSFS